MTTPSTPLSPSERMALREAAEKARDYVKRYAERGPFSTFINAANPATILQLLSERDALAEQVEILTINLECSHSHMHLSALEAQVERLTREKDEAREALTAHVELRKRLRDQLGEAIHAGLRKGTDAPGAEKAWRAIHDIGPGGWSEALSFAVWGLESGLERRLDAAITQSQEPTR